MRRLLHREIAARAGRRIHRVGQRNPGVEQRAEGSGPSGGAHHLHDPADARQMQNQPIALPSQACISPNGGDEHQPCGARACQPPRTARERRAREIDEPSRERRQGHPATGGAGEQALELRNDPLQQRGHHGDGDHQYRQRVRQCALQFVAYTACVIVLRAQTRQRRPKLAAQFSGGDQLAVDAAEMAARACHGLRQRVPQRDILRDVRRQSLEPARVGASREHVEGGGERHAGAQQRGETSHEVGGVGGSGVRCGRVPSSRAQMRHRQVSMSVTQHQTRSSLSVRDDVSASVLTVGVVTLPVPAARRCHARHSVSPFGAMRHSDRPRCVASMSGGCRRIDILRADGTCFGMPHTCLA